MFICKMLCYGLSCHVHMQKHEHLSPFVLSQSFLRAGAGYAKGGVTCGIFTVGAEGRDMRRPGGWKRQIWEKRQHGALQLWVGLHIHVYLDICLKRTKKQHTHTCMYIYMYVQDVSVWIYLHNVTINPTQPIWYKPTQLIVEKHLIELISNKNSAQLLPSLNEMPMAIF